MFITAQEADHHLVQAQVALVDRLLEVVEVLAPDQEVVHLLLHHLHLHHLHLQHPGKRNVLLKRNSLIKKIKKVQGNINLYIMIHLKQLKVHVKKNTNYFFVRNINIFVFSVLISLPQTILLMQMKAKRSENKI